MHPGTIAYIFIFLFLFIFHLFIFYLFISYLYLHLIPTRGLRPRYPGSSASWNHCIYLLSILVVHKGRK